MKAMHEAEREAQLVDTEQQENEEVAQHRAQHRAVGAPPYLSE